LLNTVYPNLYYYLQFISVAQNLNIVYAQMKTAMLFWAVSMYKLDNKPW